MYRSPQAIIANSPMSGLQIVAIGICVMLNALDGIDVTAVSFAAPGIAEEWGVDRASLGIVLSMELIGMALGSVLLGRLADQYGRRPLIMACLVVMASGMWLAAISQSVIQLSAFRFFTGIGIGGMIACTMAHVAELSNDKSRNMVVILMATGFPMGAVVGGFLSSALLNSFDWRAVFYFGAFLTVAFLPVVYYFVPESISFLGKSQSHESLRQTNKILSRWGHETVEVIADINDEYEKSLKVGLKQLFSGDLLPRTLLLTLGYFSHIITFYFVLKWVPKIVVDMGFEASIGAQILAWANLGGVAGGLLLGLLTLRFDIKNLLTATLIFSFIGVSLFGVSHSGVREMTFIAISAGVFIFAGVVGLQVIMVQSYPAELRASGVGFVIGFGRGASIISPILAGFLLAANHELWLISVFMAGGSILAAVFILLLNRVRATA